MSVLKTVLGWFGQGKEDPGVPVREAALREAYGQTIDADEQNWRKLTDQPARDLPHLTQARMQKIGHYLWEQNLLANRLIELPVAFLLAEGVKLIVEDEANQKLLDRFWRDPINDMDLKLPKKARELAIFGEQCYPAFANEHNGAVRIGYLDPALIQTVVMDPDNPEQPIGIVTMKDKKGEARRYKVIVNGPEDVFTKRTQAIRESFDTGEAFYFRVNDLSSGTRGRSDLLAQADWLDAYDAFLFGEIDRYNFLRAFIWDVTLKNATPEQVEARAKKITSPKPGSVRVHNDSETWTAEAPDLQASDTSVGARMLRNHVLGGATMPEHWFGGGGDVNRAAAAEMEAPTLKIYTMRQKVLKHILESIGRYVIMKAKGAESASLDWSDPKLNPQAIFPELSEKDLTKQAAALSQVAAASASLLMQKLVSRRFALEMIAVIATKLGIEADVDELLKDAEADAKKARDEVQADDSFKPGPAGEPAAGDDAAREAADLIQAFAVRSEARFEELRAAVSAGGAGPDNRPLAEAIAAAAAEQSKSMGALIEALASHTMRAELTLRHGRTRKVVKLADGRKVELTEEDING